MSNIIELIYRDYIEKHKRKILILFLLILFIIAGAYAYKWYATPKLEKKSYDDVANANRRNNPVNVLFFSAQWCPYCVKAKPQWQAFSDKYNGKTINGYIINCLNIDCTDSESDKEVQASIQKYGIEHYPTVKMVIDDKIIDYDASVTTANLSQFVESTTA
jgi:thiol-disulfide isomerase/thioredoxin